MSRALHDDIETELRDLFARQAAAVAAADREWHDLPAVQFASPEDDTRSPRRRGALVAAAAAAAVVLGVMGVATVGSGRGGVYVAGTPGAGAPLQFETRQVAFTARSMAITTAPGVFTAAGSTVGVNSDPGTRNRYTTLELGWHERGVEMRLFMYFTSDGHDWWANEIRTYDGRSPGDWIEYTGVYFRTPLGAAFTADDAELAAHNGPGRIRLRGLRLQAFLPPAVCTHAAGAYALDSPYAQVDIPRGASGFGVGVETLLDAATCSPVRDPHAFSYDWSVNNGAVAQIEVAADQPLRTEVSGADPSESWSLAPVRPGATILHVVADRRSDGRVVATTDIPVTVG